jgi:hypothetical protein
VISSSHKRLAVAGTAMEIKPFGSNCVRLSGFEWLIVAVAASALFYFVPVFWEHIEKFEPGPDYRLSYKLSNDYWLYRRYCQGACSRKKILVIGDSVIWGHYVSQDNTLSHYLNEVVGRDKFVNMGVDGIHPVALAGLLRYYGRDITGKDIILHFNPLWMSSKKHDLQIEKEFNFNHPKLVPQFVPNIPCYKVSYSKRISAVMQRYISFFSWVSHLRISFFENMDLPTWTLEHPYGNPLKSIMLELPVFDGYNLRENVPWYEKGVIKQDFQWVTPETSLQWAFFQRSVEILRERADTVFVLVGPFNEHILQRQCIDTYRQMKRQIEIWLQRNNVPYYMPEALPSRMYRDASHPLSEGYAELARQLFKSAYGRSD